MKTVKIDMVLLNLYTMEAIEADEKRKRKKTTTEECCKYEINHPKAVH